MDALMTNGVIGLLAAFLVQYKNPQKPLLNTVSVFIFLLFLSRGVMVIYTWGHLDLDHGIIGLADMLCH
jgi:hypothetical protein